MTATKFRMSDEALQKLRDEIDEIDDQLLELFNRRASCAVSVAEVKREDSDNPADAVNFFRPDREAQVIQRIKSKKSGATQRRRSGAPGS